MPQQETFSGVLHVSVWRGGEQGGFQPFQVPRRDNQTVLDVATYIQRHLDPGLSYRYACRVGMCGSCAMTVNGVARWTCRTHVSRVARQGRIELAPLSNLPIVKDLVTDMAPFFDKRAKPAGWWPAAPSRPGAVCPSIRMA
ncbi:2Fe-2S iron-sulfur cluster-binding protein, partial [Bordetella petrii]|uniref:2Fe-2S iron-sulfur cluster-binding protein n=1 Tax=Bordetella petrii TaxID=94624 RepID=UPI001E57C320